MFASNYIPSLQMRYEGFPHLHFAYGKLSDMLEFNKTLELCKCTALGISQRGNISQHTNAVIQLSHNEANPEEEFYIILFYYMEH